MVDIHTHVLPGIDDGSKSVDESLRMLGMLSNQGTDIIAATPHFNASSESAEDFLLRRLRAYESLNSALTPGLPKIYPGAEVSYYSGISRMPGLESLCIEGTGLLLLEMPMSEWTDYMSRELLYLSGSGTFKVVLAHVERYLMLQDRATIGSLAGSGLIFQANASFFVDRFTRRKAFTLLRDGLIQILGSDCHNTTSRPPLIGKAYELIRKKAGDRFADDMNAYSYGLFSAPD